MSGIPPNPKKRSFLLPSGCKDLIDVLQGAPLKGARSILRVNGKIQAGEVRVTGEKGESLGIMSLAGAIRLAHSQGLDLVEISPRARPPKCLIVDYGKFRYAEAQATMKKTNPPRQTV